MVVKIVRVRWGRSSQRRSVKKVLRRSVGYVHDLSRVVHIGSGRLTIQTGVAEVEQHINADHYNV